jgi:uncharacterized delta-60 repeat protein
MVSTKDMQENPMQRTRLRWLLSALSMASFAAHGTDGTYDTVWGFDGHLQLDASSGTDKAETMLLQPDGKMLMAGTCNGTYCATRQLASGSYDASFGPAEHPGKVLFAELVPLPPRAVLSSAALTADGGSVFVGHQVDMPRDGEIVKLNAAGQLVSLKMTDSSSTFQIQTIAVQPDGKILVAGRTTNLCAITRLLADLSDYDSSFGDANGTKLFTFNGAAFGIVFTLAIQPDGKIVAAGNTGNDQAGVVRLLANGQLDSDPISGFGEGGRAAFDWGAPSGAHAVKVDLDGSILLAGFATGRTGPDSSRDFFVNRLTPRGQQDPGFGLLCPPPFCDAGPAYIDFYNLGGLGDDEAWALAVQSDGKILVSGFARRRVDNLQYFGLARLTRYGDPDPTFGNGGQTHGIYGPIANGDNAASIAIGNGGIMIGGYSKTVDGIDIFGMAKLKLDLVFTNGVE